MVEEIKGHHIFNVVLLLQLRQVFISSQLNDQLGAMHCLCSVHALCRICAHSVQFKCTLCTLSVHTLCKHHAWFVHALCTPSARFVDTLLVHPFVTVFYSRAKRVLLFQRCFRGASDAKVMVFSWDKNILSKKGWDGKHDFLWNISFNDHEILEHILFYNFQ